MKCTSKGWVLRKWALQGAGEVGCAELVMCWHEGFPHSCLSVHICACSRGTSFTSACCSSELSFQFSSLPIKHQLNRFWTKFQFCWKRLKSIEEENRRPWLKLFFILEWIIVLEGTSQWLIQQEETAFHYQLKGVSPLHLKQLISAAVRGHLVLLSVAAPILKSKHILPYTGRLKSAVACGDKWIMWCVSSFTLWCWVRCNQSASWVGQGFYEYQRNPLWQQVPCLVEIARAVSHLPLALGWQSSVCMCSDPNLSCSVLSVWTWLKSQGRLVYKPWFVTRPSS